MSQGEVGMDKEKKTIEKNCIYCDAKFKAPLMEGEKSQMDGEYWGICHGCVLISYSNKGHSITVYCPDCGIKLPEEPKICPTCHYDGIRRGFQLKIKHFKKIEKGDWLILYLPKECREREREGILFNLQCIIEQTEARAIILPHGVKFFLWKRLRNFIKRKKVDET